jgi:hypothetical protein
MCIFEDVVSKFEKNPRFDKDFVSMLNDNATYGRLGSLGPDLPTYESVLSTTLTFLLSKYREPAPLEKWSGQLHNRSPNVFPLKMIEIAWRETDLDAEEWDEIAKNSGPSSSDFSPTWRPIRRSIPTSTRSPGSTTVIK